MNITPILEALKAAGASADMLIAAVQAYEIEVNREKEGRRAKDATRQRRHRMSRDVTVTNVTKKDSSLDVLLSPSPDPLPLSSLNPSFPKKATPTNPDFERFWFAYPKERRKEKPSALAAWKIAITKATPEAIFDSLARYCQTDDCLRGFAPFPAKWLKQERFNETHELGNPHANRPDKPKQSGPTSIALAALARAGSGSRGPQPMEPCGSSEILDERTAITGSGIGAH